MWCASGKLTYYSRAYAKRKARDIKVNKGTHRKVKMQDSKLRPYQCKLCGLWHLTKGATLPGNKVAYGGVK